MAAVFVGNFFLADFFAAFFLTGFVFTDFFAVAAPPLRPLFLADSLVSGLPLPDPLKLPPPLSLLTVAQAFRFAVFSESPRSS
ncbi:hypothetical protein [Lacipirellula parvula]|uniref:hypothetical protein n=1 Tax=Lacipirellula parvula TaxID=2650471 RepID=UPI001883605C|nr:hypothetical protein [Lacipirellula parvula]